MTVDRGFFHPFPVLIVNHIMHSDDQPVRDWPVSPHLDIHVHVERLCV